jgi:methionyl-tRNA formyltransferase
MHLRAAIVLTGMVTMRVAVLAGSLAAGIRIATAVECVPAADVCIVCCRPGRRSQFIRWLREVVLAVKSFRRQTDITALWRYARPGKLVILKLALDDPKSLELLKGLQCDVGLHAANLIYRKETIAAFRLGILNAHIGILPGYRGRSVAEWSVLQGDPIGITVFFIESGIDTGSRIVLREVIPSSHCTRVQALKKMLFGYDARMYRKALEALRCETFEYEHNDASQGKRYYVMSKMLTGVVDTMLSSRPE